MQAARLREAATGHEERRGPPVGDEPWADTTSRDHLPGVYLRFGALPAVAGALDRLGAAVDGAGPLDERTARLVKLGLSIGGAAEGAARSNARKALAAGATPEECATSPCSRSPPAAFRRRSPASPGSTRSSTPRGDAPLP